MLKDLVERIWTYLPRYLDSVGRVLVHPIDEVVTRAANPALVTDAMAFWLISQILSTALRYIAFNAETDQLLYFVASLISSAVTYVVFALAFWSMWRLVGLQMRFGAVVAAMGYVWGALSPVGGVVTVMAFGIIRTISPGAFVVFSQAMLGCAGMGDPLRQMSSDLAVAPPLAPMLVFIAMVAGLNLFYLVYAVAWLRILWRLGPGSRWRLALASFLSVLAVALAAVAATQFDLSLMPGVGRCAPAAGG